MNKIHQVVMTLLIGSLSLTSAIASKRDKEEDIEYEPTAKKPHIEQRINGSSTITLSYLPSISSFKKNDIISDDKLNKVLKDMCSKENVDVLSSLQLLKEIEKAPEHILKNLETSILRNRADYLLEAGNLGGSVYLFKIVAENSSPKYGCYFANVGEILCQQKKFEEAKEFFLKAINHFNLEDKEMKWRPDFITYEGDIKYLLQDINDYLKAYDAPQEYLNWIVEEATLRSLKILPAAESLSEEEDSKLVIKNSEEE